MLGPMHASSPSLQRVLASQPPQHLSAHGVNAVPWASLGVSEELCAKATSIMARPPALAAAAAVLVVASRHPLHRRGPRGTRVLQAEAAQSVASPSPPSAGEVTSDDAAVAAAPSSSCCCDQAFADEWQPEARRCWTPGDDGLVPGFIANMMAPGVEFDVSARVYVKRDKPAEKPVMERTWRRLEGAAVKPRSPVLHTPQDMFIYYHSGKQARDSQDVRDKDFMLAASYFQEGITDGADTRVALDVGCGDGFMARRLAQSGKFGRVFAMDTSWRQLEAARRAAEDERTGPEEGLLLLRGDAQASPFCDGEIDCVWWGLGLHVVEDAGAALKNILKALRPGGRMLATTVANRFMPEVLAKLATDAGFEQIGLRVPRNGVYMLQAVRP